MTEEIEEYLDADTLVDEVDALADLVYFALGTAVELGVSLGEVFDIVHESNMTKRGGSGEQVRDADGKTLKQPDWDPPEPRIASHLVSRYTGFQFELAEPEQCVAACLTIAARSLGAVVAQSQFIEALPEPVHPGDETADEDVGVHLEPAPLNAVLREAAPALTDEFTPASHLDEAALADYLIRELNRDRRILAGVDTSAIYPGRPAYGHFVVVAEVTADWDAILIDPGPATAGITLLHVDDLFVAIRKKGHGLHSIGIESDDHD